MSTPFDFFCAAANPSIIERVDLPPRPERRLPPPDRYLEGPTGAWLQAMLAGETTVWRHQALALEHIAAGSHVVVATATASGKTFPFQTAIIHELLTSDGVAAVFYPQKALGGDQLMRWQRALELAALSPDLVVEITGDVAVAARGGLLDRARIVLFTPDVGHAWLMRSVASPAVQTFLQRLTNVVIDEAHTYEGVFGSNSAFFYRRLLAAANRAKAAAVGARPVKFIAATATISDPAGHLQRLTGCPFVAVLESDNGAPTYGLTLLHIEGPDHGAPAEKMLADIVTNVASTIAPNSAIVFVDARQAVERITRSVARDDVWPHRSGYEVADRHRIEAALRNGEMRAVVSTSTLELGIDIPQFTIGITAGVPQTRKSLRQRVGRIGRSVPGVFAVVAPAPAFRQLGSSLAEFHGSEVEPSYLYLGNRIVQFQHARCLLEEMAADDDGLLLPPGIDWPAGFDEMLVVAQPGAIRPADLQHVVVAGKEGPHLAYPLRRIGDVTYAVKRVRGSAEKIGTIDLEKAMREAYPGATYCHLRRPYRVVEWRTRSFEQVILVEPVKAAQPTRPMLRTLVNVSHAQDAVIEQRILNSDAGSIAELCLGVSESVEGYTIGSTKVPYSEARLTDERLSRKHREFTSTGILIRIDQPWFRGAGDHQLAARRALAGALAELLSRERSIQPNDIRSVHTGIAMLTASGAVKIDDAIVIFDRAQGGLRLSSPIYDEFPGLLRRLAKGAELAGNDALISAGLVEQISGWYDGLQTPSGTVLPSAANASDEVIVIAPGSEVGLRIRGALLHRTIFEPQLLSIGDEDRLMYRYESKPGTAAWIAHDHVEPMGHNWRQMLWNPFSNELREMEA